MLNNTLPQRPYSWAAAIANPTDSDDGQAFDAVLAGSLVRLGRSPMEVARNHLFSGGRFDAALVAWMVDNGCDPIDIGTFAKEQCVDQHDVLVAVNGSKDIKGVRVPLVQSYLKTGAHLAELAAPEVPRVAVETSSTSPRAIDVTALSRRPPRPQVIEGLWPFRSILGVVAEEGEGKTLLVEQICRQALRGERVLDFFELGAARPSRVLFVDTEMEEEDALDRDVDARARGLGVGPDQLYWLSTGGLSLDDDRDVALLAREVERVQPDLLWVDSGINAITEADQEVPVKALFNNLSGLMRSYDLVGVGLTLHTRKRSQGSNRRRFDDLYGSREWKGRLNTALYMEGNRIVAWKNRGGQLAKMWTKEPGKHPYAALHRPGLTSPTAVPFTISVSEEASVERSEPLEAKVRQLLAAQPGEMNKTALAKALGGNYDEARTVIERLQESGEVVPNTKGAKLQLAEPTSVSGSKWGVAAE